MTTTLVALGLGMAGVASGIAATIFRGDAGRALRLAAFALSLAGTLSGVSAAHHHPVYGFLIAALAAVVLGIIATFLRVNQRVAPSRTDWACAALCVASTGALMAALVAIPAHGQDHAAALVRSDN